MNLKISVKCIPRNTYRNLYAMFLIKMDVVKHDAEIISDVFIAAELRGIPSHGLIRLKDYFQLWKANRINVNPDVRVVHETPSTAVVDGDGLLEW